MPALPAGYKAGVARPYATTRVAPERVASAKLTQLDHFNLFAILVLALGTRMYNFHQPSTVVSDEEQIGKQVQSYMYGEFFVDVDPPLAKLMYFFIALVNNWDGKFPFSPIGLEYPVSGIENGVPLLQMRLVSVVLSVLAIVTTYPLMRISGCRSLVAFFGSIIFIFENSFITKSQYISLEPIYILGLSLAYLGYKKSQLLEPFSFKWYKTHFATGVALGVVVSSRASGVYCVVLFGLYTIIDLWYYLGDLEVSDRKWWAHFAFKIWSYILLPLVIYLAVFAVHFTCLWKSGDGSGKVSGDFKVSSFEDAQDMRNMPSEVSYGSTITIRHLQTGSYLHSHPYNYKGGSQEQQVTLFDNIPDLDNEWLIEVKQKTREGDLQKKSKPIKDGDTVRLYHKRTGRYLRANDVRPPISEHDYNNEVSCAGNRETEVDKNYEWKVRIVSKVNSLRADLPLIKLLAGHSVFQLVHQGTKCILLGHNTRLPNYAFFQKEVTCVNEPTIPNTLWYIESNSHPVLDEDTKKYVRIPYIEMSFFGKMWEILKVNWNLSQEPHTIEDKSSCAPENWPFALRGETMFTGGSTQVYFLGNVPVYILVVLAVTWVIAKQIFHLINVLNPFEIVKILPHSQIFYNGSLELVLAWFVHFLPSFHIIREQLPHRYLPCLYFGILLVAQIMEYQSALRPYTAGFLLTLILGVIIYSFVTYIPLTYSTTWTNEACIKAKWWYLWGFDCSIYQ